MHTTIKCDNCRARKVKCDRGQPSCTPCRRYGVVCGYNAAVPIMASAIDTVSMLDSLSTREADKAPPISLRIGQVLEGTSQWPTRNSMKPCDRDRLDRFRTRTAKTISVNLAAMPTPDELVRYAVTRSHLMHAILAVTTIHDEHLTSSTSSLVEARMYHLNQTAHFLSRRLALPVDENELQLIWASSLLLHRAVLAAIDCREPHRAWPNCSRGPADLDWFRLAYKTRAFTAQLENSERLPRQTWTEAKATDIPAALAESIQFRCLISSLEEMCTGCTGFTEGRDPRLILFRALKPIMMQPDQFNASMARLSPVLKALDLDFLEGLERKDPVSLLLLSIFHAHLCTYEWWMARRAHVEGRAICSYLENQYTNTQSITDCLWYPRLLLGSEL